MTARNLTRFRLCDYPLCCKGAVIPRNRTKPNGWTVNTYGALLCPAHSDIVNDLHGNNPRFPVLPARPSNPNR